MPGWNVDMTKMQSEDEFPEEFNAYISFLEEELEVPIKIVSVIPFGIGILEYFSNLFWSLEVPIKIVSVGPDREQTIVRYTEE